MLKLSVPDGNQSSYHDSSQRFLTLELVGIKGFGVFDGRFRVENSLAIKSQLGIVV
jgi:hypothetical protein